jgi:hypothetical protein
MKRLPLYALLILSACATPQQQCVNAATQNLRVIDSLIAETEANIARGYALQDSVTFVPQWQFCGWGGMGNAARVSTQMCWVDQPVPVNRPVAIDLNEEQKKLNGLKQRRAAQQGGVQAAVAQCQAQFPQ